MKTKILISVAASTMLMYTAVAEEVLDSVVVTTKTNTAEKDTAGSVSIVTSKDITRMNAMSLRDALRDVPGLDLGTNDSSISGRRNVSIRGSSSDHILILVDGKKVSGSDGQIGHSDFQYNWVPMSSISKIEVLKGPMSSIYGSQALGGVINIITKKFTSETYETTVAVDRPIVVSNEKNFEAATSEVLPIETKQLSKNFEGSLDLMGGTGNDGQETKAALNLAGKISDKLTMSLFVEKQDREAAKGEFVTSQTRQGPVTAQETKLEGKDITTGLLKMNYAIDDTQELSATYGAGKEEREKINNVLYYDMDRTNYSVGYSKKFESVTLDAQYYVTDSDSHINTFKNNYTHNMTDSVGKIDAQIAIFDNHYIAMGYEYKKEEYDKDYDSSEKDEKSGFENAVVTNAFYVQDEISVGESLSVTLGTRFDDHEKFGNHISPTASFVYKIGDTHRLKASYGEGFKAPTLTQGSSSYVVSRGPTHTFQGNDDLKPETSKSFEMTYGYYGDKTTFIVTGFKTDIEDLITTKRTNGILLYSNLESVNMQGVEVEYAYQFSDVTSLKGSYTYLDTEDETTGRAIEGKPEGKAKLSLHTELPYAIQSTLRVNYTGEQDFSVTTGRGPSAKTTYGKYDAFTTVDVQFSKAVTDNFSVRLGVDNLTDTEMDDDKLYEIRGRFAYLGLNYKF